jgi:hypothetical protein
MNRMRMNRPLTMLLAASAAAGLAGCGPDPAETEYTTDVVDQSGGELIVEEADPAAVPVEVPETEMVPVPADEAGEAGEAGEAPAE